MRRVLEIISMYIVLVSSVQAATPLSSITLKNTNTLEYDITTDLITVRRKGNIIYSNKDKLLAFDKVVLQSRTLSPNTDSYITRYAPENPNIFSYGNGFVQASAISYYYQVCNYTIPMPGVGVWYISGPWDGTTSGLSGPTYAKADTDVLGTSSDKILANSKLICPGHVIEFGDSYSRYQLKSVDVNRTRNDQYPTRVQAVFNTGSSNVQYAFAMKEVETQNRHQVKTYPRIATLSVPASFETIQFKNCLSTSTLNTGPDSLAFTSGTEEVVIDGWTYSNTIHSRDNFVFSMLRATTVSPTINNDLCSGKKI